MSPSKQANRRFILRSVLAAAASTSLAGLASAQASWPSRAVKIVDAYTPGGSSDVIARFIGNKLSARLGQPVVVENKTGAGGVLGGDAVAKSAPDGYTLLLATTAVATNTAAASRKLPYDPVKDLTAIGQIAAADLLVVVPVNSPIKTLKDLVDMARAKPNGVRFGSSGVASMSHMGMELLASVANVQLMHVPYRGTSTAMTDLLGGQLDCLLASYPTVSQLIEGGKLRGIVVASPQRSPLMPNLPSATEAGFPGFQIDFWWGLMGPAGMPADVVKRINSELNTILKEQDTRDQLTRLVTRATPGSSDEFSRQLATDLARWSKVVKDANIKGE